MAVFIAIIQVWSIGDGSAGETFAATTDSWESRKLINANVDSAPNTKTLTDGARHRGCRRVKIGRRLVGQVDHVTSVISNAGIMSRDIVEVKSYVCNKCSKCIKIHVTAW